MVPAFTLPEGPGFPPNFSLEQAILDFLNTGGTPHSVIDYLRKSGKVSERALLERDLTNDGVLELVVGEQHLRIYTCKDQKYYTAADLKPYSYASPFPLVIQDMNLDGMPEVVITRPEEGGVDIYNDYQVLEWDGQRFQNLVTPLNFENRHVRSSSIEEGWIVISGAGRPLESRQWDVRDIDHNGILELVLTGGVSLNLEAQFYGPWRTATTIYMWNGDSFVLHDAEFEPPRYRFQAVQDADYAAVEGKYDRALELYEQVIFNKTLDWWSRERQDYEFAQTETSHTGDPTPTLPAPDASEYDNLAAYARYRIMLLHILTGRISEAQAAYNTLQAQFPVGHPGYAYAEMAAVFWNGYQSSQNMGRACNLAIEYASEHTPEILYYIGDRHHSGQSLYYEPKDICPFK